MLINYWVGHKFRALFSKEACSLEQTTPSCNQSLREKCPNKKFFWSVFSCIRTEYGDLLRIQKNTDQKKLRIWTLFTQWANQLVSNIVQRLSFMLLLYIWKICSQFHFIQIVTNAKENYSRHKFKDLLSNIWISSHQSKFIQYCRPRFVLHSPHLFATV